MHKYAYPAYPTSHGYLTKKIRTQYISRAIDEHLLPENAHKLAQVVDLTAPNDPNKPIQFWQLYSVLGEQRIVQLIRDFYRRVFADEPWFRQVFERVGPLEHHVRTQAAMWIDTFGGGMAYHGGEFRLNFHHTHNAMALMNDRGAQRWNALMVQTLNNPDIDFTDDPRVKPSICTFLGFFMGKYAGEFNFSDQLTFGTSNPALKLRLNFLKMSTDEIEALDERALRAELILRRKDVAGLDKAALVAKALSL